MPATQWLAQFYNRHKQATPAQQAAAEFWRARPDRPSLELWKAAVAFDGDWKERTSQPPSPSTATGKSALPNWNNCPR